VLPSTSGCCTSSLRTGTSGAKVRSAYLAVRILVKRFSQT
jgi:hypothetical protein